MGRKGDFSMFVVTVSLAEKTVGTWQRAAPGGA